MIILLGGLLQSALLEWIPFERVGSKMILPVRPALLAEGRMEALG